ncbi:MAG: hypothetical protein JNK38_18530, partial [Acidobacteria bacterium]|nr:hypothetical protein [Acidobacteriota bacterium]
MSRKKQINQTAATVDHDELLAAIRREPDGLTIVELAELFEFSRAEQKSVSLLLNQLQGCGLLRQRGQEFRWADSNRAMVGTIRQRRRKTINFIPDDAHERARGRIRVAAEDLNGAFDGDRVVVSLARAGKNNDREARVE